MRGMSALFSLLFCHPVFGVGFRGSEVGGPGEAGLYLDGVGCLFVDLWWGWSSGVRSWRSAGKEGCV